jgi:hypothetical protein
LRPTGRPSWRLHRRTRQWEAPALVTALQQVVGGGAGDTKAAAGSPRWPPFLAWRPYQRWRTRPLVASPASLGMAAAAWASPANKPSRRRQPQPWIGRGRASASDIHMPSRIGGVTAPKLRPAPQGPSRQTGGDKTTGTQPAGAVPARSPVVRILAGLGDGDSNQLLTVPRGHRPHDGGRKRVEVTMLMTLLAVTRAELGMVAMGRRSVRCGAGSGASARFSGGCWPASPKVALAGVAASGREYAIRVRGRATTVVPEAATPGLPGQPGPNRPLPGVAADHKSSYARIRPPPPPGGWPRAGPL